jgi:NHL repeat-containing protein
VRSYAKASSAESTRRQTTGLGCFCALWAAAIVLALPSLSAAKTVVNGFGESQFVAQGLGAQFKESVGVRGVAVNGSGIGAPAGTSFVVDAESRLQSFDPTGIFQRAWGQDVVRTTVNEQQHLTVRGGGTFTLTFKDSTTAPIPGSPGPFPGSSCQNQIAAIDDALDVLPSIGGDANVTVIGDGCKTTGEHFYVITFTGALASADQPQLTIASNHLTASSKDLPPGLHVSTLANGANAATTGGSGSGFEVCTVADYCKNGSASGSTENGGQLNDPQGVAVNQSNGHVYVTESGNRRVSEFDADGNFIRAWGWDVISAGKTNDNGSGFEICDTTSGNVITDCQQGASGASGGQFGSTLGYPVVDSSDNVWVPDPSNGRIQEFSSSGSFIAAHGYNVDALGGGGALESCASTAVGACQVGTVGSSPGQFSAGSPAQIAFDSLGNLYAIDSGNTRVQKFDPALTTATNFAPSTFSTYTTLAPERIVSASGGSRLAFAINRNIGGSERQILEIDPTDASVKDTSFAGHSLTNISGLAFNAATGNLYATTNTFDSPRKVLVLSATPLPDPVVTVGPVIDTTDTAATLSATVKPNGGVGLNCKFQYSTDQLNWLDAAAPDCDYLDPNGGAQAINRPVAGLNPNTHYFVRFSATRKFILPSLPVVSAGVQVFDTDPVPPIVSDVGAVHVADTSARFVGTIDPRNSNTGYVFQYGLTPALGSTTAPVDIGGGVTPVVVSQVVGGLNPDTTYYFRLVATNLTGTTASPSGSIRTRGVPLPPSDHRAYEMVSPPDKNLGDADHPALAGPSAGISIDGQSVAFCTLSLFGEPAGQGPKQCAQYISRRTAGGWQTTAPFPRVCRYDVGGGSSEGILDVTLSPDFDQAVLEVPESPACAIPPLDPAAPLVAENTTVNLYHDDLNAASPFYGLMTPKFEVESFAEYFHVFGASDDLGHVVFRSHSNQTDPPDSPAAPGGFWRLYDWEKLGHGTCTAASASYRATIDACLTLVSKDPSNEPFTTGSALSLPTRGLSNNHAVSADGERIYFQNSVNTNSDRGGNCGPAACQLYLRENGTTTYEVAASECTSSCGSTSNAQFQWATPAGDKALFASCSKLTNASAPLGCPNFTRPFPGPGVKLFRWDLSAAPGQHLTDLTLDHEPADGVQADFQGILGASDDGDAVYFMANHQIVSGQPTAPGAKLYRWHWNAGSPVVDYLGSFDDPIESTTTDAELLNLFGVSRQVTPNGEYLLIRTHTALDPIGDRDSDTDVYRWGESDGWACVSCQLPGVPSAGDAHAGGEEVLLNPTSVPLTSPNTPVTISDDGQRVFFDTPDALVDADVNGESSCLPAGFPNVLTCTDVYEWHDGTVSLVSSGTGDRPSYLISSTASGNDVFFFTSQRLVGWDVDGGVDIYDARIGGGFPEPEPLPAPCEGEACRNAGTTAPGGSGAGTAAFQGPGNPTPKRQKARKNRRKHHGKRAQRKAHNQRQAHNNRRAGR